MPSIIGIIPYDSDSRPMRGADERPFVEQIRRGAFASALRRGALVEALWKHDEIRLLASTATGSLVLTEGYDDGLRVRVEAQTLSERELGLLRGGSVGMSFGFRPQDDVWWIDAAGMRRRALINVELLEVTFLEARHAAYPGATARLAASPDVEAARERMLRGLASRSRRQSATK